MEYNQKVLSEYEVNRVGGDGKGKDFVKPQDISLFQERLFENLSYFADFCETYNIKYCLSAGTCLGAVRENDFIPWDDDLDVAVLREDFDKLFELWDIYGDKDRFSLCRTTKHHCANVPIGLLRNKYTTYVREYEKNDSHAAHGVKIDIEPMDEVTSDPLKRRIQYIFGQIYALFLTQREPRQCSKTLRIGSSILLKIFKGKSIRYAIIKLCEKQVKKYNGTGCEKVAINAVDYEMFRKDLVYTVEMEFHGRKFNVPGNYGEYLKNAYGEYTRKPPVEKRKPLDTPVFYDLNTSFKEYNLEWEKG